MATAVPTYELPIATGVLLTEALPPDIKVYTVNSLRDPYLDLTNQQLVQAQQHLEAESALVSAPSDVRKNTGQEHIKRALEIAAAGSRRDLERTDDIECHQAVNYR